MKIVLAYSGGLDTSCIVPWLVETYGCEVVCCVGDVGQGDDELAGVEQKAIRSGASSCHVVDLRREFLEQYVFPTVLDLLGLRSLPFAVIAMIPNLLPVLFGIIAINVSFARLGH